MRRLTRRLDGANVASDNEGTSWLVTTKLIDDECLLGRKDGSDEDTTLRTSPDMSLGIDDENSVGLLTVVIEDDEDSLEGTNVARAGSGAEVGEAEVGVNPRGFEKDGDVEVSAME